MRQPITLFLVLALSTIAVGAAAGPGLTPAVGSTGPFVGTIGDGMARTHAYDNNPSGQPCIQLARWYTVTLTWSTPGDTLTLSAGGKTASSSSGTVSVSFEKGVCAAFPIVVTGTSVADKAVYTVQVNGGAGGASWA